VSGQAFFVVMLFARWRKQFAPYPFKIYTEFKKKYACTNETAARDLCNERLGVLCYGLSLNCFSKSIVVKPIGLFKRGGRVPKSFFFEKPNEAMSCFRSAFQSTLLKHAGEVFFCSG